MCGIAGIVNTGGAAAPGGEEMRRMLAQLRHRGPDQFGIYLDDHVALGSARLSIVDLEGGQQPIGNEDGTLWIVYNGEVFNHPELRAELESRGHRFATHTDTEVIVHLYEEFGPACLDKLNGQFAFALWDTRRRALFLARDRLGVRPLFYAQAGGRLLFASEIKALFSDASVARELDAEGVRQVFSFWAPVAPRTCFRGIHELPPGCYLELREGAPRVASYWTLAFESSCRDDMPAAVEEFRSLLTDAVSVRLRADVPVGAYLSGGLDSSAIASIIRRLDRGPLDTFSISFTDPQFDESEHQLSMARFLGTTHQVVHATHEDIGRVFPDVVWHTEAALTRTAPAPMFLLSQLVRDQGYKVVLTGEGADEFLGGYDIFKEAMIRRFWARQPESRIRPLLLRRIYPDIPGLAATGPAYLQAFFGGGLRETNAPDFSHQVRWKNNRRNLRLFAESGAGAHGGPFALPVDLPCDFSSWGPLERAQYLEIRVFLSGYLLSSQGDRVAMAHSVEGRHPFLDHRLVAFCNRLPARFKLRGLREKRLLREAVRDWLPAGISNRLKRPYRAPIRRCFAPCPATEYVEEMLDPGAIGAAGVFKPQAVDHLVTRWRGGGAFGETDEMALVGVLSTQLLHHRFVLRWQPAGPLGDGDDVKVVDRSSRRVAGFLHQQPSLPG